MKPSPFAESRQTALTIRLENEIERLTVIKGHVSSAVAIAYIDALIAKTMDALDRCASTVYLYNLLLELQRVRKE